MNLNKVQIFGNLTRDPELTTLQSGNSVCKIGVCTNRSWKNKDGETQEEPEYHNLVAWGKTGEIIAKYLGKGDNAYFEGRLKTSSWETEDGNKRYKTEIIVESFQFGYNKKKDKAAEQAVEADPFAGM